MGTPDTTSCSSITWAREADLHQDTPYGPVLVTRKAIIQDGAEQQIDVADPFAFLHTCMHKYTAFKDILMQSVTSNGNVMDIVICPDEVNPGRALGPRLPKQMQSIYWSLLCFGPMILSDENAWFTINTTLSSTVKDMAGGMAQLFKIALIFFC